MTFNLGGYVYQNGIEVLRLSYETAEVAISGPIKMASADVSAWEEWLASGGKETLERDEDGFAEGDKGPQLVGAHENAIEAQQVLRKAFAISFYHYWERWSQNWHGRPKRDHHLTLLKKISQNATYTVDDRMDDFHTLINILKHNKPEKGDELHCFRIDLFKHWFDRTDDDPDWEGGIQLQPYHMHEFLDILAKSGPTETTSYLS